MSLGTLSEKRNQNKITTTTTQPQEQLPKVKTAVVEIVEERPQLKEPSIRPSEPQPVIHVKDSCAFCQADAYLTLAIRGGLFLVMLALCYNLIKSAKK